MGFGTMSGGQYYPVPSGSGAASAELLARIANLENEVSTLKAQKAAADAYGLAKITDATDVTETDTGLVLGAVQNNPSIEGTLAHRTAVADIIARNAAPLRVLTIPPGGKVPIIEKLPPTYCMLVFARTWADGGRACWLVSGYSDSSRNNIDTLVEGAWFTLAANNESNTFEIETNFRAGNSLCVVMDLGFN